MNRNQTEYKQDMKQPRTTSNILNQPKTGKQLETKKHTTKKKQNKQKLPNARKQMIFSLLWKMKVEKQST